MGQKVTPNALRYGINKNWISRWNALDSSQTGTWLVEDEKVRKYFYKNYASTGVDVVEIERQHMARGFVKVSIVVYVSQVGLIVGKANEMAKIEKDLTRILGKKTKIAIDVLPSVNAQLSAHVIAQEIAAGIENRQSYRQLQKSAIKKVMSAGGLGIKTKVSGRLGGVEIAREEGYSEGVVPLSTLRADIDYAFTTAKTTYGIIGVKVWINRGMYWGKGFMGSDHIPVAKKSLARVNRHPRAGGVNQSSPRSEEDVLITKSQSSALNQILSDDSK